jgi:hypothetical protein
LNEAAKPETKRVTIMLAALTRVEWSAIVEVPKDMTQSELEDLVDTMYDEIDGGEFTEDTEFWDKGECRYERVPRDSDAKPEFVVTRAAADPGDLTITKVNTPEEATPDGYENQDADPGQAG